MARHPRDEGGRACGFVEEGRERESCWVDGRWCDDIVMGLLDREFAALDGHPTQH